MGLLDPLWRRPDPVARRPAPLEVELLEDRTLPDVSGVLAAGTLAITGTPNALNRITLTRDAASNQLVLQDFGVERARFDSAAVANITIDAAGPSNFVTVAPDVLQPAVIRGGPGTNRLTAGGGPTTLIAGGGENRLIGGTAADTLVGGNGTTVLAPDGGTNSLIGGAGRDLFFGVQGRDTVQNADPILDRDFSAAPVPARPDLSQYLGLQPSPTTTLTTAEVDELLQRAAAASASDDGIIAIVDRGGRVLGVRVEGNVSPAITGDPHKLVFAIDGAIAEARTGAFFGNDQAPLTARTIQFISQTTMTQREIESDPSITDLSSTLAGPGFVAPVGIMGHFPPNVPFTPQVDLFAIEHTNRDTTLHPVRDPATGAITGYVPLPERFNIDPAFIPSRIPVSQQLAPPDSYGYLSGLEPTAQPRGIGTLPGGIPIVNNGVVVGGIGVFFPGQTGFADAENSSLNSNYDPTKPDRSLEAEYVAFAAVGGSSQAGFAVGSLGGVAPLPGFDLPFGRIDLVGISLPLFGPGGLQGPENLVRFG